MSLLDNQIPVFESPSSSVPSFYFSQCTSDCPLCLSFHIDPILTNCGHAFCKECLSLNQIHFGVCPICFNFISATFPVKWHFFNDLKLNDWVSFKMVKYKDGERFDNFENNPFSRKYFLKGEGSFTGDIFYQVADAGNYFFDFRDLFGKIKKWEKMPFFISGRVLSLKRVEIRKGSTFGLKHCVGMTVYYVKLY